MPSRREMRELRRQRRIEENEISFRRRMEVAGKVIEAMRSPGIGTVVTFVGIKGMNKVGLVDNKEAVGLQLIASMGTIGPQGPLGVAAVVIATILQGVDIPDILGPIPEVAKVTAGVVTGNVIVPGPLDIVGSTARGLPRANTPFPGPVDVLLNAFGKLPFLGGSTN